MRSLHLITDGRLMHTIQLERGISRQQIQANRDAINRLEKEATGPSGIIICDADNMEIGYIEIPDVLSVATEKVIYDKIVALVFIAVVSLGYLIVH